MSFECSVVRAVLPLCGGSHRSKFGHSRPARLPPSSSRCRRIVIWSSTWARSSSSGADDGVPGVGGAVLTRDQMWTFDRKALDQAVNLVPGVVSTFDANGRRNESDIFVRGFGRWQVPLMLDGVRIYLPADNRLDFSRFLTADIAAVQIQKGYASVLDGPGAMGGAINLVTRKPTKPFEVEASAGLGGRGGDEAGTATRWPARVSGSTTCRAAPTIRIATSGRCRATIEPTATSLQPAGTRLSSDSADSRLNLKAGFTPNATDEYTSTTPSSRARRARR